MKTEEIALGALLHDIGKFLQRAHPPGTGLSEQSRRLQEMACPYWQGRSSHLHVLYTNEFVSGLPFLPDGVNLTNVANLATYHHRPDTLEQRIITEADRLSSAMEREAAEDGPSAGASASRRVAMLSVASTVDVGGVQSPPPASLRMIELSPENAFPVGAQAAQRDLTPEYACLWDAFCTEWGANRCADAIGFINRACSTLERFTWCIPSATNAVPDISLYDHMKTTAAIAVCLASAPFGHDQPFLLVAGDLAGIQDYIFDITPGTGGLARRLRSRSFDVNAFAEAISLAILRETSLPLVHRILFAGGKFHMLLPNTEDVHRAIDSVRSSSAEWLFERSSGILHLAIASM
ncbi:HD domain-containing protein, partial [bacterium]|nr:HD domain-containing protein [bacterium]